MRLITVTFLIISCTLCGRVEYLRNYFISDREVNFLSFWFDIMKLLLKICVELLSYFLLRKI